MVKGWMQVLGVLGATVTVALPTTASGAVLASDASTVTSTTDAFLPDGLGVPRGLGRYTTPGNVAIPRGTTGDVGILTSGGPVVLRGLNSANLAKFTGRGVSVPSRSYGSRFEVLLPEGMTLVMVNPTELAVLDSDSRRVARLAAADPLPGGKPLGSYAVVPPSDPNGAYVVGINNSGEEMGPDIIADAENPTSVGSGTQPCVAQGVGLGDDCRLDAAVGEEPPTAATASGSSCSPLATVGNTTTRGVGFWHGQSGCGSQVVSQKLSTQLQLRKQFIFRYWSRVDGASRTFKTGGNFQMSNRPSWSCDKRYRTHVTVNFTKAEVGNSDQVTKHASSPSMIACR